MTVVVARRVALVGPGKVGSALARALAAAGDELVATITRDGPLPLGLPAAEVVLVAVPDGQIERVAERLAESGLLAASAVVLHTAGARGPSALAPLAGKAHLGTFHPLQTFARREVVPPLAGVPFALAGDARAVDLGRALARRLGGEPLVVEEGARALYHAAAVLACGHVALLADVAARALGGATGLGHDEALALLGPILRETVTNLAREGMPGALTGPIARGDTDTVARHEAALRAFAPAVADAYRALATTIATR